MTDDYRCCLADFGLALAVETLAPGSSTLVLNGSIRWLALESLDIRLFDHKYAAARDVYAFGCTVIEVQFDRTAYCLCCAHLDSDILW